MAQLPALPEKLARRVVELWLREPMPESIRALATNAQLRALTIPQLEKLLNADSPHLREAAIAFFVRQPALAHIHARALSERLGDEDRDVRDATHALIKAQPSLLDLPVEALADWLQSERWTIRLGAVWAADLNPKLARHHVRDLSERLGDSDWRVRDAAQALFKVQPELLDLPTATLAVWLQSDDEAKRLGAIWAADFDPKLARAHARNLSELLGNDAWNVSNAARTLFKAQPELLNLPTATLTDWLQSENGAKRLGLVWTANLDPKLARLYARGLSELLGDKDRRVRDPAYALFKAQPDLLDLPPETLAAWLQNKHKEKRLGAVRSANLNPKLARAHARTLSKLLGDADSDVRDAAHDLFKAQPELLDLPGEALADWVKSRESWQSAKRLGAAWVADLDPALARAYARDLSEWLGDEDRNVRGAAYTLFKAKPGLLNLPAETLAAWLQSENRWKRLAAVQVADLDPELAHAHTHALSERLGDKRSEVQDAAYALFEAHPRLLNLPPETLAAWLQSKDVAKRLGAVRAATLDPQLARAHALSKWLDDENSAMDEVALRSVRDPSRVARSIPRGLGFAIV